MVLVEELFASESPRFLAELAKFRHVEIQKTSWGAGYPVPDGHTKRKPTAIGAFAVKWISDKRPWARRALLEYVGETAERPGQKPLVKRLLKLAEERDDRELVGRLLVSFDRLGGREAAGAWVARHRPRSDPSGAHPFSARTHDYLVRRAVRFFRRLGAKDEDGFRTAVLDLIVQYEDANLGKPGDLLDAWGLVTLLHHGSEIIARNGRGFTVVSGHQLSELQPAPMHEDAWLDSFEPIFAALLVAKSVYVRRQLAAWLRARYAGSLASLSAVSLRPLLFGAPPDLQAFGVELLRNAKGMDAISVDDWMTLLEIDHPVATPLLVETFEKNVSPKRLDLAGCARLACSRIAVVAALGTKWALERTLKTAADLETVMPLCGAPIEATRAAAADAIAAALAEGKGEARHARDLVDARHASVRAAGLRLLGKGQRFFDDASLWCALAESPYDDVRAVLLRELEERERGVPAGSLVHVWTTTVLSVHRGSKEKRRALLLAGERIAKHPEEAETLLRPVGLALRSVREPERRSALASIVRAASRSPELRAAIGRALPELRLGGPAA